MLCLFNEYLIYWVKNNKDFYRCRLERLIEKSYEGCWCEINKNFVIFKRLINKTWDFSLRYKFFILLRGGVKIVCNRRLGWDLIGFKINYQRARVGG